MKIKIICFGKLDTKYFEEAGSIYFKWLTKFCDLEIIELKEEFNNELEKNKFINCQMLENKIGQFKDFETIIMDVNSEHISSEKFAEIIEENKSLKSGKLSLVIGPSDGFTTELREKYKKISFGSITLPHQLFRIVLLEQIFRAFKIINNEKYHK